MVARDFGTQGGSGRTRVHVQLVGIFVGILFLGLLLPIIAGERPDHVPLSTGASAGGPGEDDLEGALAASGQSSPPEPGAGALPAEPGTGLEDGQQNDDGEQSRTPAAGAASAAVSA